MRLPVSALASWLSPLPAADAIARALTSIGFEVEGREESAAGTVLEINVTPNRGDCLSVRGLARELCAALETPFKDVAPEPLPDSLANSSLPIALADPRCPRFLGVEIRGVKKVETPEAVRKLLEGFGMRPVSPLVDAANLVMLELGQPLHTYDLKALRGGIVVRAARAGEALVTLDNQKRELTPWTVKGQPFAPLLICDEGPASESPKGEREHRPADGAIGGRDGARPIGLAGVMGGGETEIPDHSVDLYLEAAAFDPVAVRRTAKKFTLHSEASHRFERGVDPHLPKLAAARFLQLLKEWGALQEDFVARDARSGAGGAVAGWRLAETAKPESRAVEMRPAALKRLLGVELPAEFIAGRFTALGLKPLDGHRWSIPSWRSDLTIEEDLIEEAGRHYGYDRIPETLPSGIDPVPGRNLEQALLAASREKLLTLGYNELVTIPFCSRVEDGNLYSSWAYASNELQRKLGVQVLQAFDEKANLENPIWEDRPQLRRELAATMLPAILSGMEQASGKPHWERAQCFEIGTVFRRGTRSVDECDDERAEFLQLTAIRCFPSKASTLQERVTRMISDFRGLVPGNGGWTRGENPELLLFNRTEPARIRLLPAISLYPNEIRYQFDIGILDWLPLGLRRLTHPGPADRPSASRLSFDLAQVPGIDRDLSLLVPDGVAFEKIRAAARDASPRMLASVRNLDLGFTGKGIPEGHRALAVRFAFRNPDDTLTAEAAEAALAVIRGALGKLGIAVRA